MKLQVKIRQADSYLDKYRVGLLLRSQDNILRYLKDLVPSMLFYKQHCNLVINSLGQYLLKTYFKYHNTSTMVEGSKLIL